MTNDPDRRPLPPALRRRLREIPRREVVCRDVERLYRATRARAWARRDCDTAARGAAESEGRGAADRAAERHLASCARCRELYGTLASALAEARRPLPRRLASRLSAFARQPARRLPVWIVDARYAAAACYLLAAVTLALAGDASAVLRGTETVSTKAQTWASAGETRSAEAWGAVRSSLSRELGSGWHRARRYRATCERWLSDAVRAVGATTDELLPDRDRSVEGEDDGRTRIDEP